MQALEDDEHLVGELLGDPDAVVGHAEEPFAVVSAAALLTLDDDPRRDSLAPELHRVADQVLPQHRQQGRVAVDGGKRLLGSHDLGARFLDRGGQVAERGVQRRVEVDLGVRGVQPPDPGEGEQVVDQRLHALGAVDREPDVFGTAFVELVAVPLLEQLAERRDLAQRLLQVVRGDVGELLEFGVGPPQLLGLLVERRHAADRDASSSSTIRCRMSSTSAAMARMSRGPRGVMRSPKLPSVMRRHAAASAASGRVTALRTSSASTIAIADEHHHHGDGQHRRASAACWSSSSIPSVRAAPRFSF